MTFILWTDSCYDSRVIFRGLSPNPSLERRFHRRFKNCLLCSAFVTSAKPQVVITGGAGFIGSHLAERLLSEGRRVLIVDNFSTGNRANIAHLMRYGETLDLIEAKVSEWSGLEETLEGSEFVVHLAAAVGVELVVRAPVHTIENNLSETEALLKAAAKTSTPVLLASTSEVYGRSAAERFSEEDDLIIGRPDCQRWGYACSKLMDEFMAMAYAREFVHEL